MSDSLVLNLGENFVRLADVNADPKGLELLSLIYQDNTGSFIIEETEKGMEEKAKLIEKLTISLKSKKKNTRIVIPDGLTFSQIVEMPKLREKELLSAIKYQADQFIPMPLDETVIDLEILNEDKLNKKLLVLIVAAPQKLISTISDLVSMAGLYPESIENELSAVGRLLSFYSGLSNLKSTVFLNFGFSTSSLYYYNHELKLITDIHNFKLGLELFLKEIQINTNLDILKSRDAIQKIGLNKDASLDLESILKPSTEELIKEIETFLFTIKDKYHLSKIEQIFLFNQASLINYLSQKITSHFGIPVSLYNMTNFIKQNQITQGLNNSLSPFISLSGAAI